MATMIELNAGQQLEDALGTANVQADDEVWQDENDNQVFYVGNDVEGNEDYFPCILIGTVADLS